MARPIILAGNYRGGIAAMHTLSHDDNADVANYIGNDLAQIGRLQDYGMWQMEQGNRLEALDDLQKVKLICANTTCEAYKELKEVIDGKASY